MVEKTLKNEPKVISFGGFQHKEGRLETEQIIVFAAIRELYYDRVDKNID